MNDLDFAILLIAVVSALGFGAGVHLGRRRSKQVRVRFQLAAFMLMGGYLMFFWDRPVLTRLLPTSNLIILANWLPIWGSFFLGVYLTSRRVNGVRKLVVGSLTFLLCAYSAIAPTLGTIPNVIPEGSQSVTLQSQSTPYTCSAACAVSLLQLHGIAASESELAELCLTRRGTHWMGLYRGLKLKTEGTAWDVVVEPFDAQSVGRSEFSPCVLSVTMDVSRFPAELDHGFQSDVGHSVVFLRRQSEDCITVFDPSPDYGIEDWDDRVLGCVDNGVMIHLVPRDPGSKETAAVSRSIATAMLGQRLTAGL